jgi:hypothetical protein
MCQFTMCQYANEKLKLTPFKTYHENFMYHIKNRWLLIIITTIGILIIVSLFIYLETLPEASPPMSFSTSSTVAKLKSPGMVCLRHEAATAKFKAF